MYNVAALICGILFGFGLTISSLIDPNKIINFLDVTGNWDPSLACVMLSSVTTAWLGYRFVLKQTQPKLGEKFFLPTKQSIDIKLIVGAALFGIGWGIAGYCPGPGITALGLGIADPFYFLLGMIGSVVLFVILGHYRKKTSGAKAK